MEKEGVKKSAQSVLIDKLAAEIAKLRLAPGNEARDYAKRILTVIKDCEDVSVNDQLASDDLDIEELLKNDKAIMGGIVAMSKMVTGMHDMMKRFIESPYGTKEESSGGQEAGNTPTDGGASQSS